MRTTNKCSKPTFADWNGARRKTSDRKNFASVASYFVSRVDTIIDKQLDALVAKGGDNAAKAQAVLNKVAIANAKLAYAHYEAVTASKRWAVLAAKNAQVQRLLWASTGTKDKRMPDVVYVEELIGPDTVNTMPPATIEAFRDHGRVADKIKTDLAGAQNTINALPALGVDLEASMKQLQREGVKSFIVSFDSLMNVVASKRELLTGQKLKQVTLQLGDSTEPVAETLSKLEKDNAIKRMWEKDATVWKSDEAHQKIIKNSLGWLSVATQVKHRLGALANDRGRCAQSKIYKCAAARDGRIKFVSRSFESHVRKQKRLSEIRDSRQHRTRVRA